MGEEDDERGCVLAQDCAEREINLGETRCPAVASQRMSQSHMLVQEPLLHTGLQRSSKGVLANEFKVIGHIVHFLTFQVGDYDEDVVASMIVHSP